MPNNPAGQVCRSTRPPNNPARRDDRSTRLTSNLAGWNYRPTRSPSYPARPTRSPSYPARRGCRLNYLPNQTSEAVSGTGDAGLPTPPNQCLHPLSIPSMPTPRALWGEEAASYKLQLEKKRDDRRKKGEAATVIEKKTSQSYKKSTVLVVERPSKDWRMRWKPGPRSSDSTR
jgi:hypothetical protein